MLEDAEGAWTMKIRAGRGPQRERGVLPGIGGGGPFGKRDKMLRRSDWPAQRGMNGKSRIAAANRFNKRFHHTGGQMPTNETPCPARGRGATPRMNVFAPRAKKRSELKTMKDIFSWCALIIGPFDVLYGDERFHGRHSVFQIQSQTDRLYLKVHRDRNAWESEVYAYDQWPPAFERRMPRLLAIHEDEPFALLLSELPGEVMEKCPLTREQEERAWHAAGQVLAALHGLGEGDAFGPYKREKTNTQAPVRNAVTYIRTDLVRQGEACRMAGLLDRKERDVVEAALEHTSVFAEEPPVPCHRDYHPANWIITADGVWGGVIDFEFARWDVKVADFSRYPNWEWMYRPELLEAMFDGYGRRLTSNENRQLVVARVQYALSAITWGYEHSYVGFVEEGRQAIKHLSSSIK